MALAMTNLKTASYELTAQERINGKLSIKISDFRLQNKPFKVYGRNTVTGVTFLYVEGSNNNKAYINPNGFPWVNLHLDIYSNQTRNNNHHTINHAGFSYMNIMFKALEKKIKEKGLKLESCISLKGTVTWNNRPCYRVQIDAPDYAWTSYTCLQNEALHSLCDRLNVLEYAVMEANKLSFSSQVSKGQQIKIPNFMAQKIVLYIDKENYLPIVQMIYDENGLYEQYEYRKINLNPTLYKDEWTQGCKNYSF